MLSLRSGRVAATLALVVLAAGCSATRFGKCKDCQTAEVYPSEPCYECAKNSTYGGSTYGVPAPLPQPAPIPAAEPLPSSAPDFQVPPPPPEAVRARPINQISATTRGWYDSASQAVRARFTR